MEQNFTIKKKSIKNYGVVSNNSNRSNLNEIETVIKHFPK